MVAAVEGMMGIYSFQVMVFELNVIYRAIYG